MIIHKNNTEPERIKKTVTEWKFPLDETKKAQKLAAIRLEAARKQIRHYPTFWEQLWNQLRFRSWKHWLLQGLLLLTAMFLVIYCAVVSVGSSLQKCIIGGRINWPNNFSIRKFNSCRLIIYRNLYQTIQCQSSIF